MSKKTSGFMLDGKWISYYDHGYNNYGDGVEYRECAPKLWQDGWRAALHNDMAWLDKCHKPSVVKRIRARVEKALGIDDRVTQCNLAAA